ncbi:MAG: ABC transporter ATP-binding protein [Micrococcaceae bacterium]
MQYSVDIAGLTKRFVRRDGAVVNAIDNADLTIEPGEFVVLLGPSGCGKTTLLRSIAGLETPDSGRIEVGGTTVYSSSEKVLLPPDRRGLSMMFQSYALWPHMTAHQNVRYPLENRGRRPRKQMDKRVSEVLNTVGIGDLGNQYPGQLSGGQQQRVALARALVNDSPVVLFDEPLSNVDAKVREQLRFELLATQRRLGFTAVFVTHDQSEAMELATRIAVLDQGKVQQVGAPSEIYLRPATEYVAKFIGTTNEMHGTGTGKGFETSVGPLVAADASDRSGVDVNLLWRPESGTLSRERPTGPNALECTVLDVLFLGTSLEFVLRCGEYRFRVLASKSQNLVKGDSAWVQIDPSDLMVFDAAEPVEWERSA